MIKNHQSRPTGSAAFSEANAAFSKNYGREYNHGRGRGRGGDRGRGRSGFYNPSQNNAIHKKHHVERRDKGKDVRKSSLQILKISVINVAPNDTGLECAEHRSIFVSFTRHP